MHDSGPVPAGQHAPPVTGGTVGRVSAAVRVFIGSCTSHAVEETVFVDSLLERAGRGVDIDVITGDLHSVRNVRSGRVTPLPDAWRGRIARNTPFSFARFVPPALCEHRGRVIYCEADMLALGDIGELWEHPLDGASLAAVPHSASRAAESSFQTEGFMSSVVLFDAARCRSLDVVAVTDAVRHGPLSYSDAICMTDRFLEHFGVTVSPLPAMWNDLEHVLPDTKIVHFTSFERRPWLHPRQPAAEIWTRAYLASVAAGTLDARQLDAARRVGGISARVRWLPRLPTWCRYPVDAVWQQLEHWVTARRRRPAVRRPVARLLRRSVRYLRKRWVRVP